MKKTTTALALLVAGLPGAVLAQAMPPNIPLWHKGEHPFAQPGPNCATGDLPIGSPIAQGYDWKHTLVQWFHNVTPVDVEIPNLAPVTQDPITAWGVPNPYPNNNTPPNASPGLCIAALALGPTSAPYVHQIESLYLNATGAQWGGDALCRMNADESHFLPDQLANQGDCLVHVPSTYMDTGISTWANIDFAGNPYAQQPVQDALLKRGAMWLVTHLIIADYLWWSGTNVPNGQTIPVEGRMPCDRQFCPQLAAPLSQSGRVLPGPIHNQGIFDYTDFEMHSVCQFIGTYSPQVFDEGGALLAHYAETYLYVRRVLGLAEQQAVEEALLTFAERIHSQGRWTQMANMAHRAPVALYLAADAQQDPGARAYAMGLYEDLRDYFYDPHNGYHHRQGTFRQLTGFDTGYHANDMTNVARLAWVERNNPSPLLATAAFNAFDLWGHLVLPDRKWIAAGQGYWSTYYTSPTAFNSRTGKSMADAMGGVVSQRFFLGGGANLPWAWAERAHTGLDWDADLPFFNFINQPFDGWASLACEFLSFLGNSLPLEFHHRFNHVGGYPAFLDNPPRPFPDPEVPGYVSRFYDQPNFAFLYGDHSLFTAWDFVARNHVDEALPAELPMPYHHAIDNGFFFAHTAAAPPADEMVAIVHAGAVGSDDNDGFGGGQLAGLSSPTGGVFSLSRRRGHNYGGADDDDMAQWRQMPMHAVSMVAPNTHWTSSSRIAAPTVYAHTYQSWAPEPTEAYDLFELDGVNLLPGKCIQPTVPGPPGNGPQYPSVTLDKTATAQHIRVCGDIPVATFQQTALSRPIQYQRDFLISEGSVSVETRLRPDAADPLAEAYEQIPLYYGEATEHLPQPDFEVRLYAGGNLVQTWRPGMPIPGFTPQVDQIKVLRFTGAMLIELAQPQKVGISKDWSGNHGASWNLLIDLLDGQPALGARWVKYRLTII